jgi:hypothetical protein
MVKYRALRDHVRPHPYLHPYPTLAALTFRIARFYTDRNGMMLSKTRTKADSAQYCLLVNLFCLQGGFATDRLESGVIDLRARDSPRSDSPLRVSFFQGLCLNFPLIPIPWELRSRADSTCCSVTPTNNRRKKASLSVYFW